LFLWIFLLWELNHFTASSPTVCQKLQPSDPGCRAVVAMPRFDPQGAANFSFPSSGAKVRPAAAAH
jgi:hypothetical protein